ncbi:MAG: ribonuclease HI family protein [Candidatus Kerfeldbacteria bacterium]|nr:ribonuclease HI family protein [Candidatus Kerfeldbacteria bacterium]
MSAIWTMYSDGGARGNPGPAAIGVVIRQGKTVVAHISQTIGDATNNQAEYEAVLAGLRYLVKHHVTDVDAYLDSELVVEQLRGGYKIKNKDLGRLWLQAQSLIQRIGQVRFHHVPRAQNSVADGLVNRALDDMGS